MGCFEISAFTSLSKILLLGKYHSPYKLYALHQLPRHQQTTIFRLRTGHCRLNSHLKRIGVKTSAQCPCGEADRAPEHYLQSCSLHQQARQQIWPTCVSLKPSCGGLQRICSWHPSMRHSWERGSSQRNHHIKGRRKKYKLCILEMSLCRASVDLQQW